MNALPFSRIAPQYDRLNALLSFGTHRLWKRKIVRRALAATPRPQLVLDVATGTGEIADAFRRRLGPGSRVIGLDPCAEMMEAGQRCGRQAEWIVAEAESLPLPEQSVDILTCAFGVRNFRDRPRAFAEWFRCLKSGGHLTVVEIHPIPQVWYRPVLVFYWTWVMPRLGGWLADLAAYEYLRDSSRAFISAQALRAELEAAGFRPVQASSLFASGMVSFSLFRKP